MLASPSSLALAALLLALAPFHRAQEQPARLSQDRPVRISPELLRRDLRTAETVRLLTATETETVRPELAAAALQGRTNLMAFATLDQDVKKIQIPSGAIRWELPILIALPEEGGDAASDLVPIVEAEGGGLRYDGERGGFLGSLLIGLEDRAQPDRPRTLPRAIRFQVTGEIDEVAVVDAGGNRRGDQVTVTHTNAPFARVEVFRRSVPESVAEVGLKIRPDIDNRGIDLELPVVRASVGLEVVPRTLPGWGLGTADVHVQLPADLVGTVDAVTLTATKGTFEENPVVLDASGRGTTRLRSTGLGRDTIAVFGAELSVAPSRVVYDAPLRFAIASLAGGLVGGAIVWLSRKKTRKPAVELGLGALWGLLAAVLWSFGLNLTDLYVGEHFSEGGVFAIAAACVLAQRARKKEADDPSLARDPAPVPRVEGGDAR
jgi:hypothetical protein